MPTYVLRRNASSALLAFYDFPASHWQHIRTSNPIESTFATVRLRTAKARGCVSRQSILSLVYKLGVSAEKRWRRLRGFIRLADVVQGVKFNDGVRASEEQDSRIAARSENAHTPNLTITR